MNKFKLFVIAALLLAGVLVNSKAVMAWGSASGDGTNFAALQETAVFLNNSGAALSAGDVVILDTTATAGTTLGAYVTTVAGADNDLAIGVVKSTSVANGLPVVVVTKGPVDTRCADLGDAVTSGSAVGTTAVAGQCGGGTELGIALEAGAGTNGDLLMIWVQPNGSD